MGGEPPEPHQRAVARQRIVGQTQPMQSIQRELDRVQCAQPIAAQRNLNQIRIRVEQLVREVGELQVII